MTKRTIKDQLREEYFVILPQIRLVAQTLETRIKYALLPLIQQIQSPARLEIKVRAKDCESAIEKLRKKSEGVFDPEKEHSLKIIEDLAGARILTFMGNVMGEADTLLKEEFKDWETDHKYDENSKLLWLKYKGKCNPDDIIGAEYQICPMLIGLFGDVEHSAIYKPTPELKGIDTVPEIQESKEEVYNALRRFESKVEEEYKNSLREKAEH